ncbi:MAG: hypothetical protein VB034_02305 [Eubacteriales bacterium]|nr:hypothetical protein [Eubacteriales bacterium]
MEAKHGTANDWQALIAKLNGVFFAHVVFSEAQEPLEIHVLASCRRNVKSIVRDVQSAISARYGIEVDYHIISVAQITPEMLTGGGVRLTYSGISMRTAGKEVEVSVALTRGEERYVGTAVGSAIPFSRMRCIAQATLDAVKNCTNGTAVFELASTETIHSNGRAIVISQVFCLPELTPLIGCVFTEPDPDAAVAQSVLDAINRKLAIYAQAE